MEKLLLNQAERTKTIRKNRTPPSKPNQTRQKPTQKGKDAVPNELFNPPARATWLEHPSHKSLLTPSL